MNPYRSRFLYFANQPPEINRTVSGLTIRGSRVTHKVSGRTRPQSNRVFFAFQFRFVRSFKRTRRRIRRGRRDDRYFVCPANRVGFRLYSRLIRSSSVGPDKNQPVFAVNPLLKAELVARYFGVYYYYRRTTTR